MAFTQEGLCLLGLTRPLSGGRIATHRATSEPHLLGRFDKRLTIIGFKLVIDGVARKRIGFSSRRGCSRVRSGPLNLKGFRALLGTDPAL